MAETTENREKIGAKVNASVYAEFKQYVQDKTGQKRGVLGDAVEAALLEYMDDDIDGDVSNADILRELREFRQAASENTPPGVCAPEENDSSPSSLGSSDPPPASSDETPPRARADDEDDLSGVESRERVNGVPVPDEKPGSQSMIGKRVAWIVGNSGVSGRVPFEAVEQIVKHHYPYSKSKIREIAWLVCEALAPSASDLPDESEVVEDHKIGPPKTDSELREIADKKGIDEAMSYYEGPRKHANGAWYTLDADSKNTVNHQEPTERGDVEVYIGEHGALAFAEDFGFTLVGSDADTNTGEVSTEESESEAKWPTDSVPSDGGDASDGSGESDGVSSEDLRDVDIEGSTGESGESGEAAEDELTIDELDVDEADRGRDY